MESTATEQVAGDLSKGSPVKTTRTRRIVSRVAIAGALAVVPVAAVAVPAFAATPNATAIDWQHPGGPGGDHRGGPGGDHRHDGPGPQGPQFPQFPQGPQQFLPQTGSAG